MILFLIWIINVIQTNSFVLQNSYNILLKDSAHYKVDVPVKTEDYERINVDEAKKYIKNDISGNVLKNLNMLASKEYDGRKTIVYDTRMELFKIKLKTKSPHRRTKSVRSEIAPFAPVTQHNNDNKIKASEESVYNYYNLVNEYHAEENEAAKSSLSKGFHKSVTSESGLVNFVKRILTKHHTCSRNQTGKFSLFGNAMQRQSIKEIEINLWNVIKIWSFAYLIIALPLWCTRGWCCCCLFCKFFKPKQTTEEAKKYLASNPPGVILTNKEELFRYEPTDHERESYEEFDHFMRTL